MQQLDKGCFDIINPFNRQVKRVPALPRDIYAIVFWSKNYGPFLSANAGEALIKKGFRLYFNFTLNSASPLLEPGVPPLPERLEQMTQLATRFGADKIAWRFDPVCRFQNPDTPGIQDNLSDFPTIAGTAGRMGVKKCVSSFMDHYPKINRRLKHLADEHHIHLAFEKLDLSQKKDIISTLLEQLEPLGIVLHLCCEKEVLNAMKLDAIESDPLESGILGPGTDFPTQIRPNACIDGHELFRLFGGEPPELRRDYGQRSKQGCLCTRALDVGSYQDHPCRHNCLYCYANPGASFQPGSIGERQ